jgi:hypothetical protein
MLWPNPERHDSSAFARDIAIDVGSSNGQMRA